MKTRLIFLFLLSMLTMVTFAEKRFYNSKCYIVGLTTNDDVYMESLRTRKYFDNHVSEDIPCTILNNGQFDKEATRRQLEEEGFGKKTLDLLFERETGQLSEELLRQRAWKNVQLADKERARHATYSAELILKEDILPILECNYILITHEIEDDMGYLKAKSWIVFHVDIDQNIWDQVNSNWNNLSAYDAISVGISYVASGKARCSKTTQKLSDFIGGEVYDIHDDPVLKDLSKKVPFLAVHGQIVKDRPYTAVFENIVVDEGERMRIFRQTQNSRGEFKSKEIGKAVGHHLSSDSIKLYPTAGRKGNPKKGDIAVLSPANKISNTLLWQNQSYSSEFRYILGLDAVDYGVIYCSYDFEIRGGWLKKDDLDTRYVVCENLDSTINSPKYLKFGLGCTYFFRTQIPGFELGPYFLVQGDLWFASYQEYLGRDNKFHEVEDSKIWLDGGIRFPLGLKANCNLWYPLRLEAGIEWAPFLLRGSELRNNVLRANNWKPGEISWFVGLRYAF